MSNIQKYYENTENALPNQIVKKFLDMRIKPGIAVDLGCGAGRDTVYLIKNGWNVLSIDREDTSDIIVNKLDSEEKNKFNFRCQSFEDIKIEKNNLMVANFSIPFCDKSSFNDFWNEVVSSILEERLFYRKFLWIK